MDKEVELLEQRYKLLKSQQLLGNELGVSKTTINQLLKGKYPNPAKMYQKIIKAFGDEVEIIGVGAGPTDMKDLSVLLKEIG